MARILVVGPAGATESFVLWIEERGHTVVRADSVDSAMNQCRRRPPDGIVTEVNVGVAGGGIGLLWQLQAEGFSIPVYIHSSDGWYLIPDVGRVLLLEYVSKNFGDFAIFYPKGVGSLATINAFVDGLTPT